MGEELSSSDKKVVIEEFKKWYFEKRQQNLNLLITGKTAVGKSRLVNALVGQRVAEEGRKKDPCTSEVTCYQADMEGVTVTVWDSPGLQDGTTNEDRYIQDMKDNIKDIALMIYCVRMDEARFHEADKKAIQTLTDVFGKEVWNHVVVALTFANKVEDRDEEDELGCFQSQLEEWKKQVKRYFTSIGIEVRIPVIPVGSASKSMRLPDRENWVSDLWVECYHMIMSDNSVIKSPSKQPMAEKQPDDQLKEIKDLFKNWISSDSPQDLNILITGKTGVGKSRLVNALVGKNVAKEGKKKHPCTLKVECYQVTMENVAVTVWDSPGLQDGTTNEDKYIQDMKDNIKDIALMIYCVRMDEARFYDKDKKAIQTLTEVFGKGVWNHAVVALTFANKVEDPDEEDDSGYFQSQLQEWEKQVKEYFTNSVGIDVKILVIPVGNAKKSLSLPDRENWLSHLWIECYCVMKASARLGMFRINRQRLMNDSTANAESSDKKDEFSTRILLNGKQRYKFFLSIWEAFSPVFQEIVNIVPEEKGRKWIQIGLKVIPAVLQLFDKGSEQQSSKPN